VTVRFDDSLPLFVRIIVAELGGAALAEGVVLRDALGRLAFFSRAELDDSKVSRIQERVVSELGPYARTDRAIAGINDFGTLNVLEDTSSIRVMVAGQYIRLVDRRLVGGDWLRAPASAPPPPPRFVFASLKGGVGRTTAISAVAAELAGKGRRVLVVDLDMEAPGLGAVLLDRDTLPQFGTIDALVESAFGVLDPLFLADLTGPSPLADQRGKIEVIPAFGRRSIENPGEVLAKLARAYAEGMGADGGITTIMDRVRSLIDAFSDANRYDAILVDARAGLHETTASAILGLGAEVFLFGLNEPQTFEGYAALLSHLSRFIVPESPAPEWLNRLSVVHAKALGKVDDQKAFADRWSNLFSQTGLTPKIAPLETIPIPEGPFNDVPWNDDATDEEVLSDDDWKPREPIVILYEDAFRVSAHRQQHLLSQKVHVLAFAELIEHVTEVIDAAGGDGE
jgi:hypothetical protein